MKGWTPQAARYFLTDLILQLCSLIQMAAMFQDKYVVSQLTAFLNRTQFNNFVRII